MPELDQQKKIAVWSIVPGMILLSLVILLTGLLVQVVEKRGKQIKVRMRNQAITSQIAEIKAGKNDCIVDPDPTFLDELFSDSVCVANVKTVYLSEDVSGPHLSRLRELPKLKSIVFLWAKDADLFLKHIHGKESIEALSFDRCSVTPQGQKHIASLPNLKSLCLVMSSNLEALRNHRSIENLFLMRPVIDKRIIPVLQSMPNLRTVTISFSDISDEQEKDYVTSVCKALPHCKCTTVCQER